MIKVKRILLFVLLLSVCLPFRRTDAAEQNNLVRGMAYTVENSVPTAHSYSNFTEGGVDFDAEDGQTVAGKLTDGIRAGNSASDSAWYHTFRSRSRYVTFAFEEAVAVSGFSAGFYHSAGSAYYAPRYVNLYLSNDGEGWFLAGAAEPSFPLNSSARVYRAELTVEPYAAKYVRIEFCCDIFACCDEIEVYGSKTLTGNEKAVTPAESAPLGYCSSFGEITDIIKLYNGYYPAAQENARNTVEELLPYVAYLSEEGEVQDTLFDALAFVPCVSTDFAYPSGGTLVKTSSYPTAVQSDWIYYTDFLFEKDCDLDALNTAVEQVYTALGKEGKFPVLLTMPYIGVTDNPFGDLDGDGTDEYARTAAERIEIVKWYDSYLTERFDEADFSHLAFVGYYWYSEEVNYTWSADEKAFTTGAAEALEASGKYVLFDPFYLSTGFDHWEELGFGGAVMQPNVAFSSDRAYFDTEMLWEFAETAQTYHLGVEIETNEPGFFQNASTADAAIRNYERYLYVGSKTGYMDALHTFYQGAGPGALYQFCHADVNTPAGIRLRRLYDITYQFIKGTYENQPPVVDLPKTVSVPAGEKTSFAISVTDPDSYGGDLKVEVTGCEHGRAQVAATKRSLIYLPDEGFEGEDTVYLSVTDGQNEAAVYEITVRVEKVSGESSAAELSEMPSATDDAAFLWYFLAVGAAVAVLAVSVVVIFLRKKRK